MFDCKLISFKCKFDSFIFLSKVFKTIHIRIAVIGFQAKYSNIITVRTFCRLPLLIFSFSFFTADPFLPRVVELATSSSDRQTKVRTVICITFWSPVWAWISDELFAKRHLLLHSMTVCLGHLLNPLSMVRTCMKTNCQRWMDPVHIRAKCTCHKMFCSLSLSLSLFLFISFPLGCGLWMSSFVCYLHDWEGIPPAGWSREG